MIHNITSSIRTSQVCLRRLAVEKAFTVEEYKHRHTHTHTHTSHHITSSHHIASRTSSCSQMFFEIGVPKNFTIFSGIPVLKSVFMFPCEYWKIKLFYRTPLVAASVPCFFLKLFFKLFVHLYYLFHFLSKTLYLRFISKYLTFSCSFSVFLPNRQVYVQTQQLSNTWSIF